MTIFHGTNFSDGLRPRGKIFKWSSIKAQNLRTAGLKRITGAQLLFCDDLMVNKITCKALQICLYKLIVLCLSICAAPSTAMGKQRRFWFN